MTARDRPVYRIIFLALVAPIGAVVTVASLRSVQKIGRRRWRERESGIAIAQELKFAPSALRIAPAEQESARKCCG